MLLKGKKYQFRSKGLLTGLWNLKDIQIWSQNHSKK